MFKRDTAACYRILLEPMGRFFGWHAYRTMTDIMFVKYRASAVLLGQFLLGRRCKTHYADRT